MMKHNTLIPLAGALALALILSGCDEDSTSSESKAGRRSPHVPTTQTPRPTSSPAEPRLSPAPQETMDAPGQEDVLAYVAYLASQEINVCLRLLEAEDVNERRELLATQEELARQRLAAYRLNSVPTRETED